MSVKENIHASAVLVGSKGILICGPSGSGKSTLALRLIAEARQSGQFSRLVCDDRADISMKHGRLIACCPQKIAGKIEAYGAGIISIPHVPSAIIHWVVELTDRQNIARMPEDGETSIQNVVLPRLHLPGKSATLSCQLIFNTLGFQNVNGLATR